MLKKFSVSVLIFILLFSMVMVARADDASTEKSQSELTVLGGNQTMGKLDYSLGDHFQIQGFSQDGVANLGLRYQPVEWFGIRAGATYDSDIRETVPYGGIDFNTHFGTNNLRLKGYYDYNFYGKDWSQYEVALRIQMYEHLFLDAGVRGDAGNNVPTYSYNSSKEALLFLRGVFDWTSAKGKWTLNLHPILYVNGTLLHDYTVQYNINDKMSIMANANTLYNPNELNYRAGVRIRF